MHKPYPVRGRPAQEILGELDDLIARDLSSIPLAQGAMTYYGLTAFALSTEPFVEIGRAASARMAFESQFFVQRQAGLIRLHADVVGMVAANLDGGDPGVTGLVTMGGTESNIMACRAARDHAVPGRVRSERPEIVVPYTAHPSFNKAAEYLGMKVIRVPVGRDFTADPILMEAAITPQTVMIVGSAPDYTLGVIDPIPALAEIALRHRLWVHVDSCVGGIIGPFLRRLDPVIPAFDFSIPGVSSISADLHKHGYAPVGISILLFRNEEMRQVTEFRFDDWPNGLHRSPALNGSRPAAPLAGAWAIMNYLGDEGYLDLARRMKDLREAFAAGIGEIEELEIFGNPRMSLMTYGSSSLDCYAIGDLLESKGWTCFKTKWPEGQHIILDPFPARDILPAYFRDLKQAVMEIRRTGAVSRSRAATY